jgi:serine/threonine-protein kinase
VTGLQVGDSFNDRYQVLSLIGRGGMGTVYHCRDTKLDRSVAVKILKWSADDQLRHRFEREARIVANLSHSSIVGVYDIGVHEGTLFVVQEFLDGSDLSSILAGSRGNGLPRAVAAKVGFAVADALAFAHSKEVVHRDVKPSNIRLLADGVVKVLDFGIATAKQLDPVALTQEGTQIGTPAYMSPEQLRAEDVDRRSDIYAFGVVCYEILSGRPPFKAKSVYELATLVLSHDDAPPLAAWDVPDEVVEVVEHCLKKNREDRPADMAVLAQTFNRWLERFDTGEILMLWPVRQRSAEPEESDDGALAPGPEPALTVPPTMIRPIEKSRRGAAAAASAPESVPIDPIIPAPPTPFRKRQARVDQDLAGHHVGRFMLHEFIARGRSGPFYKAYDPVRGTLVGVKLVDARDEEVRRRIFRAGRIWLTLRHPNLVSVLEVQPDYGNFAAVIVSELVDGEPLSALRDHPQLSLDYIISIGLQLCDALGYMHDQGLIHREVRPRNILVSAPDYHIKLLDSGIARHANPEIDAFTQTGAVVGDLTYASPELFEGRGNQRADVYAVGAVLHELITGRQFDALSRRLDTIRDIPPPLRSVIELALDPEPSKRFASAQELAEKLRSIVPPSAIGNVVVTLHGIRTNAKWQRAFAEVANVAGLEPRLDRWNFGYFSSLRFLLPWARRAKVQWFRATFELEFPAAQTALSRPSIIAHSFGTYIVGYALLRYPYLRLNRVLLCGSILPAEFPWDVLLERGQVQAVRNEYGSEDIWTELVDWFIPGTGRSGVDGFSTTHPRLEQERFTFAHSEYFERGHMTNKWLPFLKRRVEHAPIRDSVGATEVGHTRPWGLYTLYGLLTLGVIAIGLAAVR